MAIKTFHRHSAPIWQNNSPKQQLPFVNAHALAGATCEYVNNHLCVRHIVYRAYFVHQSRVNKVATKKYSMEPSVSDQKSPLTRRKVRMQNAIIVD